MHFAYLMNHPIWISQCLFLWKTWHVKCWRWRKDLFSYNAAAAEKAKRTRFVFLMALLPPSQWLLRVYSASTQFGWISICPRRNRPVQFFSLHPPDMNISGRLVLLNLIQLNREQWVLARYKTKLFTTHFVCVNFFWHNVILTCRDKKSIYNWFFFNFVPWLADILEGENSISGRKLKEQLAAKWLPSKYISNIRLTSNK